MSNQNPGSDAAAETVAALAAASIVFKDSKTSYSSKLLQSSDCNESTGALIVTLLGWRAHFTALIQDIMMGFSAVHHGFITLHKTVHTWHTSSPMATLLVQTMMIFLSVGTISKLGPKSFFQKFYISSLLQNFLDTKVEEFQVYKVHSDNYICSLIRSSGFQAQYTTGTSVSCPSDAFLKIVYLLGGVTITCSSDEDVMLMWKYLEVDPYGFSHIFAGWDDVEIIPTPCVLPPPRSIVVVDDDEIPVIVVEDDDFSIVAVDEASDIRRRMRDTSV
ncbi:hypothetical protein IFM89_039767 [Coptis chinensis]|uniref:cellulase n=1 Tax=Coptis chinensis TaxID=261450 RepID=A0A835GTI1_9MAGN|nr:hypothetical protein IFM89_039767 [Coptis chinensis]